MPLGGGIRPAHQAGGERRAQRGVRRDLQGLADHPDPARTLLGLPGHATVLPCVTPVSAGSYDKFAHAVSQINWALTTESYRSGDVEHAGLDEHDIFGADPRQLEHQPATKRDQPYFEVLVVESVTEEQERTTQRGPQLAPPR